jgi:murein DD-endopeptidase MepM/ murein hydrolase activator NlpD
MKQYRNYIVISLTLLLSLQAYVPALATTGVQQEIQKNKQIIKKKKRQEKTILKELGSLRKNIYVTQRKLNHAYKQYNDYHRKIKDTQQKLVKEKQSLASTQRYLNQTVHTMYKEQHRPILSLIFNSHSFSNLINNMYFYEKMIERDFYDLVDAKEKIKSYQKSKQHLEKNKRHAKYLKKSILKQRYTLKSTRKKYQNNLSSLRKELKEYERRNKVLMDESEQLSSFIQRSKSEKKYYGTGRYTRPAGGYISSRYGLRRHPIFKRRRMHTGMDFAAPRGYRIKATDSGYVLFSGYRRGYGNVTIINHGWRKGKKVSSLYAHQWKRLVKKGQYIKKGQLIGYVGSTGYSTGPHLHFEIRENGRPVNPTKYLRL